MDLTKADTKNPDKAKIRWVPTPDDIVEEMMKLGGVKKGDIVYEPGPGDGRVLIAAIKHGAVKAVGIELDPKKAAEATGECQKGRIWRSRSPSSRATRSRIAITARRPSS